jgi:hypothetical protein
VDTAAPTAATALSPPVSVGAASETLAKGLRPTDHLGPRIALPVPSLGLAYRVIPADGLRTVVVRPGAPAAQIRLQKGDVALPITTGVDAHVQAPICRPAPGRPSTWWGQACDRRPARSGDHWVCQPPLRKDRPAGYLERIAR